jgi:accessory gene regulator B
MIKQMSNRITAYLIQGNIIDEAEAEIYQYGIKHIIINMVTLIIVSLLATVGHTWIATIFFFVGFMPIRLIAGGYHAKTPLGCNILSLVIYSMNMILVYSAYVYVTDAIVISTGTIISIIIFIIAPVDHKNRTLEAREYSIVKKRCRIMGLLIISLGVIMSLLPETNHIAITGTIMGSLTASISLVIGRIIRGGEFNEKI